MFILKCLINVEWIHVNNFDFVYEIYEYNKKFDDSYKLNNIYGIFYRGDINPYKIYCYGFLYDRGDQP